jgi:hypothetical protein
VGVAADDQEVGAAGVVGQDTGGVAPDHVATDADLGVLLVPASHRHRQFGRGAVVMGWLGAARLGGEQDLPSARVISGPGR